MERQYFAARDPDTGAVAYYRLEIKGDSGLMAKYHMQAGYFSTQAVDVLRGQMPNIPELDLPPEKLLVYDELQERFGAELLAEERRLSNVSPADLVPGALDAHESAVQEAALADGKLDVAMQRQSAAAAATQAAATQTAAASEPANQQTRYLPRLTTKWRPCEV